LSVAHPTTTFGEAKLVDRQATQARKCLNTKCQNEVVGEENPDLEYIQ
jgi:hypothetical protein